MPEFGAMPFFASINWFFLRFRVLFAGIAPSGEGGHTKIAWMGFGDKNGAPQVCKSKQTPTDPTPILWQQYSTWCLIVVLFFFAVSSASQGEVMCPSPLPPAAWAKNGKFAGFPVLSLLEHGDTALKSLSFLACGAHKKGCGNDTFLENLTSSNKESTPFS